jgi:hypothetical protein
MALNISQSIYLLRYAWPFRRHRSWITTVVLVLYLQTRACQHMILLNLGLRLPPAYYTLEPNISSASLVAATWIRVITNASVRPLVHWQHMSPECKTLDELLESTAKCRESLAKQWARAARLAGVLANQRLPTVRLRFNGRTAGSFDS